MTDRDKSILEYPEKMCDYCCNFDKEHIGMDGTALCKLTMTLAYFEDYSGNCMFYNVPKEQIIVPPCNVGDKIYMLVTRKTHSFVFEEGKKMLRVDNQHTFIKETYLTRLNFFKVLDDFGKTVFLTKEEAENALKEREGK
jgi:hypothetical protein